MAESTVFGYNGRHTEDLGLRPNDAIQWRAIHDAWQAGFREYDFGEVLEYNQGLARFKSEMGSRIEIAVSLPVSGGPRGRAQFDNEPEPPARRITNALWSRLPLRVSALLGDFIYRYL